MGLTKTEVKLYLSLLKLGETTTTALIKDAKVHASKVYEFLERLIQKGLVTCSLKENKKHFLATNPVVLRDLIAKKREALKNEEQNVEKLLPTLQELHTTTSGQLSTRVYEGLQGIRTIYEVLLEKLEEGDIHYVLGQPSFTNASILAYLDDWHKRRAKKGILSRYIFSTSSEQKEMELTQIAFLPKEILSPLWIEIFANTVIIGHLKQGHCVLFTLSDEKVCDDYLSYFEQMWDLSDK